MQCAYELFPARFSWPSGLPLSRPWPTSRFRHPFIQKLEHRQRDVVSNLSKRYADLIIPEGGENQVALDAIISRVETLLL